MKALIKLILLANIFSKAYQRQSRIHLGTIVDPSSNEIPWIMEIAMCERVDGGGICRGQMTICGASIIAQGILVTAAHCFDQNPVTTQLVAWYNTHASNRFNPHHFRGDVNTDVISHPDWGRKLTGLKSMMNF